MTIVALTYCVLATMTMMSYLAAGRICQVSIPKVPLSGM